MVAPVPTLSKPPGTAANTATNSAGVPRLALPIGVGIRLGGVAPNAINQISHQSQSLQQQQQHMVMNQFPWGVGGVGATTGGGLMGLAAAHASAAAPPVDTSTAERRQRNREHAKRSRVRKKFMLESLQSEVRDLQRENQRLRLMVQAHVPENALQIIADCCTSNPLFEDDDDDSTNNNNKLKDVVGPDFTLMQSLTLGQQCFVLSDPKLPDNPIVFASPAFYKLTGYSSKEVLGRNCRFLQGPGTNTQAVDVIRKAIASGSDATVCLLNYKADGSAFWNQFFIAALRDSDNNIVNYVRGSTTAKR